MSENNTSNDLTEKTIPAIESLPEYKGSLIQALDNLGTAFGNLKREVWAVVEPPLTAIEEWFEKLLNGGKRNE